MSKKQSHPLETAVQIFAPKEVGITLVPLSAIEESDNSFLWASCFLSFSTCGIGSAISLFASEYSHSPFIWLVAIFGVVFLIFSIIFFKRACSIRAKARAEATKDEGEDGSTKDAFATLNRIFNEELTDQTEGYSEKDLVKILRRRSAKSVGSDKPADTISLILELGGVFEKIENGKYVYPKNSLIQVFYSEFE